METVVNSLIEEIERPKQIPLFFVSEDSSIIGGIVNNILEWGPDKPSVKNFCRVGAQKHGKPRPVKSALAQKKALNSPSGAKNR